MTDQSTERGTALIESKLDRERTALIPMGQGAGQPYGIIFRNVGEIMEWAKMMALDPTMPKHLQGKPATCLHVVSDALGWRMDPFKVALLSFVVSGTLCYMAQISTAVINMKAPIKGRIKYRHDGEGDRRRCTASATCLHVDDEEVVEYTTPEVGKISPKNSPLWKTDPDQQLCYYAGRALCRRYFPDVLLGTYFRDEVVDNPKMIEHREYERISNPLGGNGEGVPDKTAGTVEEWNGGIVSGPGCVGASRREPAGEPDVETVSNQPKDQKASPGSPTKAGGPTETHMSSGTKRAPRKQTRPDEGTVAEGTRKTTGDGSDMSSSVSSPPRLDTWTAAFPTPWNRQSSASYVGYALVWMDAAPSQERAKERWNTERAIRNGLANPLDKEQMAACQDALGKVGS